MTIIGLLFGLLFVLMVIIRMIGCIIDLFWRIAGTVRQMVLIFFCIFIPLIAY